MHDGFVDLRAHRHGDTLADHNAFWPSFTDIMTVVVMIFLLTSVIVIVRNWKLVDNLRASILAEQQLASARQQIATLRTEVDERLTNAKRNV
ncbi:MAG TPA: hypothetical protein VKB96_13795, partial [Gammaproteobacteria bacterium]|nr:hypothetical protein [Gammaproteobacteria bacterium]